jgi:hypothetical protein
VSVRELPHRDGRSGDFGMPDRLTRSGHDQVIYRPGQDLSAARNHFLPDPHLSSGNHGGNDNAAHGFTAGRDVGNPAGFQPGRPNNFQHSTPNVSMNPAYGNALNRQWNGAGPSPVRSSQTASGQREDSNARNFKPNPAWHPAPTWQPAPAWHPAPSQSWNGGSQNSGGTRSWGGGSQSWNGGSQNWGGGMSSAHSNHR